MTNYIFLLIFISFVAALATLLVPQTLRKVKEAIALVATGLTVLVAIRLFGQNITYSIPWLGFGIELSFRVYLFNSFLAIAMSGFAFLSALYSYSFMQGKPHQKQFYFYLLITIAMANGAVLADNLVLMLFFWEGLLLPLFGLIAIGREGALKTAIKAFIIVGICDLCMMMGIGLTAYLAGTMTISKINLPVNSLGSLAFVLLMIGAISKGGSMPFHSWIPDAAVDAPLPFMAILPASLEKLLGIYFLARISLDMFKLDAGSWISMLLMIIGIITILLAVMMALVQKDYKRLLSYHAISQVGYMMLGIGTCLPVGIVGGLFHMINHAMYKSCLFLTAGSVEKQTGLTDMAKLGGIGVKMPLTFACFLITAASISGVPPFNGFYSKELVYDAALERGIVFYIAAILGSFFTAASFLKLGHAVYLGKLNESNKAVKEAPAAMLIPMIVIASMCIFFGLCHVIPVDMFKEVVGSQRTAEAEFAPSTMLIAVTIIVLAAALLHHLFAAKVMGGAHKASEHIHISPVLQNIYVKAEKGLLDPYNIGLKAVNMMSTVLLAIDRAIDFIYEGLLVRMTGLITNAVKLAHTGSYSLYVIWSLAGVLLVILVLLRSL
jgi:formate hydrogenlyase subunit 3/multisubunit Na+/H+ antiporter MnhD subunit